MNIIIRPIQLNDNKIMSSIIKHVLEEFGCTGPGWASSDPEMDNLFNAYQKLDSQYFVVEDHDTHSIVGGGGYARLAWTNPDESICELQKVYLLKATRGLGIGKKLIEYIIDA